MHREDDSPASLRDFITRVGCTARLVLPSRVVQHPETCFRLCHEKVVAEKATLFKEASHLHLIVEGEDEPKRIEAVVRLQVGPH